MIICWECLKVQFLFTNILGKFMEVYKDPYKGLVRRETG